MVQFLALSVRLRSFPGNGSFRSLYVIAAFDGEGQHTKQAGFVFFPLPGPRFCCSRISTEAREEEAIKNQEAISTVTKKIAHNRPFTNKFVSVPQGGGKYIPK